MSDAPGEQIPQDGTPARPPRRRGGPRRATSGPTGGAVTFPAAPGPGGEDGGSGRTEERPPARSTDRSADDTDTGWGERPTEDDDERLLRDVPPHW